MKNFSIRDVDLRISQNETTTIAARSCQLLKDKTEQEIFITSLSENWNDRPCSTCIVMLSCTSEECSLDSVAMMETRLYSEYTRSSNKLVFPIYNVRKNSNGSKGTEL